MSGLSNINEITSTLSRVVTVAEGELQGYNVKIQTGNGQEFVVEQFLEIPYALPPVGELRFQKPVPATPWPGIKLTPRKPTRVAPQMLSTKFGGNHPGEAIWNPTEEQTEDCLFVNIWNAYQEAGGDNSLKPVMVWIHGGGFSTGSANLDLYNGTVFAAIGEVLLVSINYRLGEFGFVPSLDAEGKFVANQALWDQCLALEWVRDNIAGFGGDPNNVCLFGESAGAGCVGLQLFSPKSLGRGLFHKAIIESGSPLSEWAITPVEILIQNRENLREYLFSKYGHEDVSYTRENILQTISAERLIELYSFNQGTYYPRPFTPCIDGDFFPKSLRGILKDAEYPFCPVIIGATRDEAQHFLLYEELDEDLNIAPSSVSKLLSIWHRFPEGSKQLNAIVTHYSNSESSHYELVPKEVLFDSVGDRFFQRGTFHFIDAFSHLIPCWLYRFSYRSPNRHPWPEWTGVMHTDELQYHFGVPLRDLDPEIDDDAKMSLQIIQLWTNFAKMGDPSSSDIVWPKVTPDDQFPEYLELANDKIGLVRSNRLAESLKFLDSILPST